MSRAATAYLLLIRRRAWFAVAGALFVVALAIVQRHASLPSCLGISTGSSDSDAAECAESAIRSEWFTDAPGHVGRLRPAPDAIIDFWPLLVTDRYGRLDRRANWMCRRTPSEWYIVFCKAKYCRGVRIDQDPPHWHLTETDPNMLEVAATCVPR